MDLAYHPGSITVLSSFELGISQLSRYQSIVHKSIEILEENQSSYRPEYCRREGQGWPSIP
jgi:hypothetical protein